MNPARRERAEARRAGGAVELAADFL